MDLDIDLGNNCRVDLDAIEEKSAYERFSDKFIADLAMWKQVKDL